MRFANGRVTVIASDATVREILAEWSRVGGSTFVDADKIPSNERLTIRLEDQSELDAIDVLLRSVAGYMVAPVAGPASSASAVSRVFILPTSTPAPYVAAPPAPEMASPDEGAPARLTSAPVQPDDDGPVRVSPPPQGPPAPTAGAPQAPLGQASPLINSVPTQTTPGLGIVTSSQPGVVIAGPGQARPGRPTTRPTQTTRPGGGGQR
ncbi:MAG: hypothetical protein H0X44_06670 [Acidobacteria bacterium]|nr:hypothetical protein [Acidobacteriota bacterium]